MEDNTLKGSHAPRPKQNKAKPGDLVVPYTCPTCKTLHYVWIDEQRMPELLRDELGRLVKDENGIAIPKTHIVRDYISVPRIHPGYSPEMEPELKILYERSQAERDYTEKNPKPKILAEVLA
jgi:hypothetical protein